MKEENPLEQQRIKIEALKEEMKEKYGKMFDKREEFNSKINGFILQLETFEKEGLVFNKEEIINGLKESLKIQDKEKFVAYLLKILEPLMILKFTQPRIIEKVERDVEANGNDARLSDVLSATFENERADIHFAPASELIKDSGIGNLRKEIKNGLIKLAEIIKTNDKIKEVWATSWLVIESPLFLEKLGFTIIGTIPEMENDGAHFDNQGQRRPIASAFMKREDFLERYGDK